jgi:hypothetical protein
MPVIGVEKYYNEIDELNTYIRRSLSENPQELVLDELFF